MTLNDLERPILRFFSPNLDRSFFRFVTIHSFDGRLHSCTAVELVEINKFIITINKRREHTSPTPLNKF